MELNGSSSRKDELLAMAHLEGPINLNERGQASHYNTGECMVLGDSKRKDQVGRHATEQGICYSTAFSSRPKVQWQPRVSVSG